MSNPIELGAVLQQSKIELSPRKPEPANTEQSFADMLTNAISSVDQAMDVSDQKVQNFIAGETDNVHDVMISMRRAQISFQLMVEVRNKAVEAYQEISRMQI